MFRIIGCYAIPDISNTSYPVLVHDHNFAIFERGEVNKYLHLERFTRNKFDSSFPLFLEEIARELKLIPVEKTVFIFVDHEVGRACITRNGQIRLEAPIGKNLENKLEPSRLYWFGESPEAYILNHELAHIFSCVPFYGIFKENSLLVHFDGGASKSNFSAWTYKKGTLELTEANYDLKWLSSLFNANALVFALVGAKKKEQNAVPGKFMGLEAYGDYKPAIEEWLRANGFFEDCWASKSRLFESIRETFGLDYKHIDNKEGFFQDIAATIHAVFIREAMKTFERLKEQTGAEYLYYTGGTALNIKLNKCILKEKLFKEVFIPPCTNDSGLALGAASAGAFFMGEEIKKAGPYLNNYKIDGYNSFEYAVRLIEELAKAVADGKVIALCNGYGEAGPRALGNRSIIARADKKKLADYISQGCKKREWYRPVAPVILEKNLSLFTGYDEAPEIAQFMLTEFDVLEKSVEQIAGCVHVDGTSRIQVIKSRDFNPFLYDLLCCLERGYGIKALINTSFNQQGEPIVHTFEQAVSSAKEMKLDGVVLNGELRWL